MNINDKRLYLHEAADDTARANGERYKLLVLLAEEKIKKQRYEEMI